ncbi:MULTISPECIES: response regulator transcription factor [Micromonospora]|uniref:response regulator transcription factor n=1 Tax=Micromonospora TaxID=1873 RepID=UPI0018D0ED80|nr:LuxR C-terminal-related transcriptional regulator [Micromonospora sp. NRRL B-16802]
MTVTTVLEEATSRLNLLTEREKDVFYALGCGMANAEVARNLTISERTVKHHVTEIMAKLGLESRLKVGIVACITLLTSEAADSQQSAPPATPPATPPGVGGPAGTNLTGWIHGQDPGDSRVDRRGRRYRNGGSPGSGRAR